MWNMESISVCTGEVFVLCKGALHKGFFLIINLLIQ